MLFGTRIILNLRLVTPHYWGDTHSNTLPKSLWMKSFQSGWWGALFSRILEDGPFVASVVFFFFPPTCTDPFSHWIYSGSIWGVWGFLLCAIISFLEHPGWMILVQRVTKGSHISCIILCLPMVGQSVLWSLSNPPITDDLEISLNS